MPITRNTDQSRCSLEEFYQEIADQEAQRDTAEYFPGTGQTMLRLLARINELFPTTQLWGLTSLGHLVVQNADNWQAAWLIRITGDIAGTFYFEYLLPAAVRPWPDAVVRGEAQTLAEAERYLLIAMRECQGWEDNPELAALYHQFGLAA